ncbi:MAG: SoxR reducing system RseC family protein [Desulfobacterales bacterium]|nr:SoxR reducing system RseC family protein [Desulfobacterales bacterium]MBF0398086.1 SoxR reducing system RseC family protein [Desulfobacterales bacterium]
MSIVEGFVTKIKDNNTAWVKTQKAIECESCAAKSSCNSIGGGEDMEIEAINFASAKVGDCVSVELTPSSLIKIASFVYLFPIIFLLIGAFIGYGLEQYFNVNTPLSAICSVLFLIFSFFIVKVKGEGMSKKNKYRPRIIRIKSKK